MTAMINTAADFKKLVGKEPFNVVYRKKDGRFRSASAQFGVTHDSTGKPIVAGSLDADQAAFENEAGTVRYFDRGADGYRQFKLDRLLQIEVGGKKFKF